MAKQVPCAGKCGKMLKTGIFASDSYLVNGKYYCYACLKNLPKYMKSQCYECAYYGVDNSSNGFCKYDHNKYVDRYKNACEHFESK